MKLCDILNCGNYVFKGCLDDSYKNELKRYGFLDGVNIEVLTYNKKGYVVKVLGCKYIINSNLANVILLSGGFHGE